MRVWCGGLSRVLSSPRRPLRTTQPLLTARLGEGPPEGAHTVQTTCGRACSSEVDLTHLVRALGCSS